MTPHTVALLLILLPVEHDAPDYASLVRVTACLLQIAESDQDYSPSVLHARWVELYDAPPAADVYRWPSREYARECSSMSYAYRSWLADCQKRSEADYWKWQELIHEAVALNAVWETVWGLWHSETYYRRRALKRLRELIGEEAYYAGSLPPHVPVWRFREAGDPLKVDLIPLTVYPPAKLRKAR